MSVADDLARVFRKTDGQLAEERYWDAVKREFEEEYREWNEETERWERVSPGQRWVRSGYDPYAKDRMR